MNRPLIVIHNAETNEITEREMNAEELAQWHLDVEADQQRIAQAEAKAAEKAALLDRLGITEEEVKLLLA
jgi:predicted metal-dependent HD superfamily phosphohydrolase